VSIGTGSTPAVRRDKAMSSFMETGSILIEGATSVNRVEESLAVTLSLVPNLQYFRWAENFILIRLPTGSILVLRSAHDVQAPFIKKLHAFTLGALNPLQIQCLRPQVFHGAG